MSQVRLFDPELNGYLSASSDRDKGEVLDALPSEVLAGTAIRKRAGGAGRPHCAYLKPFTSTMDPGAPVNLSAKVG
jgi:hypothetical protein